MKYEYPTLTRTLTVFGVKMTHIFDKVNASEIDALVINAKLKEARWRDRK